jgi:hypothetical protein
MIWNFLVMFLLQAAQAPAVPATAGQKVVVGLDNGTKVTLDNAEFTGFIDGRSGDAMLLYRERTFHGEMPVKTISRIEFGPYKKGKPFAMKVTLRNGDQLDVQSERRDFVEIRGRSELGSVTIKHPDPISSPTRLSLGKPNRKKDLTIQYLEFPAS